MFMPALASFSIISLELLAGPSVQMILVRRKSRRLRSLVMLRHGRRELAGERG